jgi:hypothetical protein
MVGGDPRLQSVSYRGTSGRKLIALCECPVSARSHAIQPIVLDEPGERRLLMLIVRCRKQLREHHEAAQATETVEESQKPTLRGWVRAAIQCPLLMRAAVVMQHQHVARGNLLKLGELIQQCFCVFQIGGISAFGEPAVD